MFPSLRRSHVNYVEPHSNALASLETTSAGTHASNPSLRECVGRHQGVWHDAVTDRLAPPFCVKVLCELCELSEALSATNDGSRCHS
eukprot:COSAG06_NODE_3951_length_4729_cov_1.389201_2_plen_87_part_00